MKNNYIPPAMCLWLLVLQLNTAFSQIQFLNCTSDPSSLCVQDEGVRLPANNKFIVGESDPNATSCSVHLSQKTKVQALCGNTIQYQVELITNEGIIHILRPLTEIVIDSIQEAELSFDSELSPDQLIRSNGIAYTNGCNQYHTVRWIVTDACNNTVICERQIRLYDCSDPVLTIIGTQTIQIHGSQVGLYLWDFIVDVADDCSADNEFRYSFVPDREKPDSLFHLCDFPNWSVEHLQDIWIGDRGEDINCDGTIEWIERRLDKEQIKLVIVDPGFVDCWPDNTVTISGKITTENNLEIGNVQVSLLSDLGIYPTYITDGDGQYVFEITPDSTINIIPERLDNPRNGVSTLDIVKIMKHLLLKDTLDTPYKLIAADANNSQHVSVIDIVELRKLILGVYTELPHNKSWRFVPLDYIFPNPFDPWQPDTAMNSALDFTFDGSQSAIYNFTGIKIGDVNGTVTGVNSIEIRQSNKPLQLLTTNNYYELGEMVEIKLSVEKDFFMQGFQFTVSSDELEFLEASSDKFDLSDDCNALFGNRMTFSWFDIEGVSLHENDVLLTIKARAKKSGSISESLQINSTITTAEAYGMDGEIYLPSLQLKNAANEVSVYPNPWTDHTTISFHLTKSGNVKLELFSPDGRSIYQKEEWMNEGKNEFDITSRSLSYRGVAFYSIKTGTDNYTGSMLISY